MTVETSHAVILFAHGARDALWARPLHALKAELERIRPQACVRIAFLELQRPSLPEALDELARCGARSIDIAPIFWSQGGHIATDLPPLIEQHMRDHPGSTVRVLPVLADLPGMHEFLALAILTPPAPSR